MTDQIFDLIASLFVLTGALLCFGAAVSLVRFPDVLGKMHAITKPQVLGLISVTVGISLSLRTWWAVGLCLLVVGAAKKWDFPCIDELILHCIEWCASG